MSEINQLSKLAMALIHKCIIIVIANTFINLKRYHIYYFGQSSKKHSELAQQMCIYLFLVLAKVRFG